MYYGQQPTRILLHVILRRLFGRCVTLDVFLFIEGFWITIPFGYITATLDHSQLQNNQDFAEKKKGKLIILANANICKLILC